MRDLLFEEFFVQGERERQVNNYAIINSQTAQFADQMVHVTALQSLIVEPDRVGLLVMYEHAVFEVENLAQQQHKELFLDAARIVGILADEHHLERLLQIVAFLLRELIERVLDDVIAAHKQRQERIHRVNRGQED
jgi:hypothetical protein